jgi:hypothetical protein
MRVKEKNPIVNNTNVKPKKSLLSPNGFAQVQSFVNYTVGSVPCIHCRQLFYVAESSWHWKAQSHDYEVHCLLTQLRVYNTASTNQIIGVRTPPFSTLALVCGEWPHYPLRKKPLVPKAQERTGGWVGPRAGLDTVENNLLPLSGIGPRQPSLSPVTKPTELFRRNVKLIR